MKGRALSGTSCATATAVAFASSATMAARIAREAASKEQFPSGSVSVCADLPGFGMISRPRMSPVVNVPVLSKQRTSTRARTSTAGNSWIRTPLLARMAAASPKFIEVSRTSPCGIIPTTPATVKIMAERHELSPARIWDQRSRAIIHGRTIVIQLRILLIES